MATVYSKDNTTSYRSILKATSLFGSVQVYQILIQVLRAKVIAILLGPVGVGVLGLFQSAIQFFQNLTNMGLSQSAVRDVSEAFGAKNEEKVAIVTAVVRRLVWITGIFGSLIVACLSPVISKISFGNYDYTFSFFFLALTLLLDQVCAGQKVILQGTRKLKDLAKTISIGATFGLIVSIPLYYILGIHGIVPTLILNSLMALAISWYYSRKVHIKKAEINTKQTIQYGRQMLRMGLAMSISGIMATFAAFVLRSYIREIGGTDEVGYFQAGYVIVFSYVGLVFNAMATDYYPRLASVNEDNDKCRQIVNLQGEIATLILSPLLCMCIVFMPFAVTLLYSDKFMPANDYITWACLGMMFRLSSWLLSYVLVAKAETKLFMYNEIAANIYTLVFSLVGYNLYGITGLGLAFCLTYILYYIQVYAIVRLKYNFSFSFGFVMIFSVQLFLITCCLLAVLELDGIMRYVIGCSSIIFALILSVTGLFKRLKLRSLNN